MRSTEFSYTPEDKVPPNVLQDAIRKPCPFCGARTTGFTWSDGYPVIVCGTCRATGPQMRRPKKEGDFNARDFWTLELWNCRTQTVPEGEDVENLREQIREKDEHCVERVISWLESSPFPDHQEAVAFIRHACDDLKIKLYPPAP